MSRHRKHRKNSIAHDAVYGKEAVVDWLARGEPETLSFFSAWRELAAMMGPSSATLPDDITTRQLVDQIGSITAHAETWFITEGITALVVEASRTMPPHAVRPEDVPSPSGWLYFERPMEVLATDGSVTAVRAMLWQQRSVGSAARGETETPGMITWFFSDLDDLTAPANVYTKYGEEGAEEYVEGYKRDFLGRTPMMPVTMGVIANGRIPWVAMRLDADDEIIPGETSWVMDTNPWLEDAFIEFYRKTSWTDSDVPLPRGRVEKDGSEDGRWVVRTPNGERVLIHPDPGDRWLLTLFRFLQQKLPAIESEPVAKSVATRLRNKGMPAGPITTITWRKRESSHATGTGRVLTYRHTRRGHWRKQWYGPTGARYMVPIYIHPTLVGDASLPLRIREVANAVVR